MKQETKTRLKIGGIAGAIAGGLITLVASLPKGRPEDAPLIVHGDMEGVKVVAKYNNDGRHGYIFGFSEDKDFDSDGMNDLYLRTNNGTPVYTTHSMDLIRKWKENDSRFRDWYKCDDWIQER